MTPKEEAIELVRRYYSLISGMELSYISKLIVFPSGDSHFETAKQCALIAVDEIIEALNLLLKSGLNNDFDILKLRGFYMKVKQEIERI
jgi:hypothetical protein